MSRRVLLTRAEEDAQPMALALEAAGWKAVLLPLFRYEAGPDLLACRAALAAAHGARVVLTSPRAATALPVVGVQLHIAVVGPRTANAALATGQRVAIQSAGQGVQDLLPLLRAAGWLDRGAEGIHWPTGADPRPEFGQALAAAGVPLIAYTVYRQVSIDVAEAAIAEACGALSAIVHASPRAAEAFYAALQAAGLHWPSAQDVAIGPTTAAALRGLGRTPITADTPSEEGIVAALRAQG